MPVTPTEVRQLLTRLREQAAVPKYALGSHQLDAHWSLAYACGAPPESWEMYRAAALHLMPCTQFFVAHESEIVETVKEAATWELLRDHALEKLRLDAGMTGEERKAHWGFVGGVQYFDAEAGWITVADVPAMHWFDNREFYREQLEITADEGQSKIEARRRSRLEYLRKRAQADPTSANLRMLDEVKRLVHRPLPNKIASTLDKPLLRQYLAKLDTTRDFRKTLFVILRAGENRVRAAHGIPAIGEGWVSETELLYRVRRLLPEHEVVAHGQPRWLGRQHLDIWLPTLSVGIEYQGLQHFKPVGLFGGDAGFEGTSERDAKKRMLCERHAVRLIEVAYDDVIDDAELLSRIMNGPPRP